MNNSNLSTTSTNAAPNIRKIIGDSGEAIAVRYLISRGYRIIARQWRTRGGEIDIVAKEGSEIVFVEVKARSDMSMGYPEESVHEYKRRSLRFLADRYMNIHNVADQPYRIDVIAIRRDARGLWLRHLENAVGED